MVEAAVKFALLTPWLVALCVSDVRHRRLPNVLTLGGLLVALVMAFGLGGAQKLVDSILAAGCAFLFLIIPFLMRAAGAGDVKMLAAAAAFLGLHTVLFFLLATSFAGLLVAIVMICMRQVTAARLKHAFRTLFDWKYDRKAGKAALPPKDDERARVPFGCAIAIGTWATLIMEALA
jgi:Flp pilus assembly protein protease CpaA